MTSREHPQRPSLETALTGAEFSRWYWLKTELVAFARSHRLSTTGGCGHGEKNRKTALRVSGARDSSATRPALQPAPAVLV